ncbi:helicase associated domain-containing protein [Streptomyces sp. NPDC005148]
MAPGARMSRPLRPADHRPGAEAVRHPGPDRAGGHDPHHKDRCSPPSRPYPKPAVGLRRPGLLIMESATRTLDVRAGPRDHARDRGREAEAAPYASRQVDRRPRGRPAALRPRGSSAGHLQVPRKHVETVLFEDGSELQFRLGAWVSNQRNRVATLTPERVEQLSQYYSRCCHGEWSRWR